MSKPLPQKLRAKWDALIETEGKKLGLENCRPFLEGKIVNDIFYEGTFKGGACIVKCSSKAPESIENEFRILERLHKIKPQLFPKPFCCSKTPDKKMAFIAMEKVIDMKIIDADAALKDVLDIAQTLHDQNIVHRDIYKDNFFFASNGHLRLFDFQFAIDRTKPIIPRWLLRHWKYHYVIFARIADQPAATWNDITALRRFIRNTFSTAACYAATDARLAEMEHEGDYRADIPIRILPLVVLYSVSLFFQRLLCKNDKRNAVLIKRLHITRELALAICNLKP